MSNYVHHLDIPESVFNHGSVDGDSDERDSLISRLLDRNAESVKLLEQGREREDALRDENFKLRESLDDRDMQIIKLTETLLLAAKSGDAPSREAVLQDMAQCWCAYAKRRDVENSEIKTMLHQAIDDMNVLVKRAEDLERRDAANDAGSTPRSHDTVTQKQIQSKKQKEKEKEEQQQEEKAGGKVTKAKIGPRVGHKGHARRFNPDFRTDCILNACPDCSGALLELPGDYWKTMIELDNNVAKEGFYHVRMYFCAACGPISSKPESMIDGTIIGKKLLAKLVRLSKPNKTEQDLYETINITYEKNIGRNCIDKALVIASEMMLPGYVEIHENIAGGTVVNPDESRSKIAGKKWWMWCVVGDHKWVMFFMADSRGKLVLETVFPFPYLKATSDAYIVYRSFFVTLQLCWAHVHTKLENAVAKHDTPETRHLYSKAMDIYHKAKELPPDTTKETLEGLAGEIKHIGQQLLDLGVKAGTYLLTCADNLFTFVTNTDMDSTNNRAERTIRGYILKRNASYQFATIGGAQKYCIIASNLATWKIQDRDPEKELLQLFASSGRCGR